MKRRRHPFDDRPPRTEGEVEEQLVYLHASGEVIERHNDVARRLALIAKIGAPIVFLMVIAALIWGQIDPDSAELASRLVWWTGLAFIAAILASWGIAWLVAKMRRPSPEAVVAAAKRMADLCKRVSEQPVTDPETGHVRRADGVSDRLFAFDPHAEEAKVFVYLPTSSGALFGIEPLTTDSDDGLEALQDLRNAIGEGSGAAARALFESVDEGPVHPTMSMRTEEVNQLCDQLERAIAASSD